MKRRWISSPRASSANCALTTAPCTASVISMNRTGRWKATTGHAGARAAGHDRRRHVAPARAQLDRQRRQPLLDQRRRPRRLVSGVGAGAEPGREHQFAALEQVVRLRHLDHVRPADLAPERRVADHDLRQRPAHDGQLEDVGEAQHDVSSCIMAEHPTHCPLRVTSSTGRVGNGQTEGVRVAATQAEADIHLEGVSKRFADMTAVDDLTLSIPRGDFFAMLGPSGCGKTTTLRMIGGFEDPTAGRVFLGGSDVTDHPPYKRDVNTVFQSYALFPHLSVEKNVAFGLERKKVGKAEVRKRAGDALELVQLGHLAKRKPPSSPAASSSASRSPARSSTGRARCCSTSRSARSTCACASSCRSSSSGSSRTSASRSCT